MDLMNILKKCPGFLLIEDRRVSFLHPSAKSYIRSRIFRSHVAPTQRYSELTQCCIEYVGRTLRKNRGRVHYRRTDKDISVKDDITYYSTLNWITHLSEIQSISNDRAVYNKVRWFLQNHFIDWVDDLVLREQLSVAAVKLQAIDLSLQESTVSLPTGSTW